MFEHEEYPTTAHFSWDEIAIVRHVDDPADKFYDDSYEDEDDMEDLGEFLETDEAVKSIDPTDAPEPLALLAKRAEVKETVQQVVKEIPNMPRTAPFDTPEPMGALAMMAGVAAAHKKEVEVVEEDTLSLEDAWFEEEPKYEAPVIVLETPKKKGWFTRLADKFGNFLDTAVPVASAGALAFTLGSFGSAISTQTNHAEALAPVQALAVAKAETPSIKTSQAEKNQMLINKHAEIVQNAGGEKARYLHSEMSHQHFIAQLEKWGGFRAILEHPAVKEAKTTAQMINLVDEYFGEKVADLVEANAAAMHLPA